MHRTVPSAFAFAIGLAPVWLCSCATVFETESARMLRASESCYAALRERQTPRVDPSGAAFSSVPLLSRTPPGSRVLGTFKISADFKLILSALQHNARRVGADAVVVHRLQWWDIRNWAEPKNVTRTETVQPTEQEKKDFQEKLKQYEEAKKQGKAVEKPCAPKASRTEEQVFIPGHWNVAGNASLEASFIERVSASK
jgi:hypothetical protein